MKIYCIGIGGIGLSALARYYKHKGYEVSGSDASDSELVQTLKFEGIDVVIGTDPSRITPDIDCVVYTIAIPPTQAEFMRAQELGIPCKTYPQALGEITKEKKTIAVCGTHGKTTTTALTYYALKACGINPTVIIGSLLAGVGTNFIPGDSEYMVVEACEYKRSFLNLHPTHIVVTNIDADHLDYYKDLDDIKTAFQEFADKLDGGFLVTHADVDLKTNGVQVNADLIPTDSISLQVLGEHNRRNAQLVIALCQKLGLPEEKVRSGLQDFHGTWRRIEFKGVTEHGVKVYDDYGHHPTEIRATIEALRPQYKDGKLYVFFQPHLYSRTKHFLHDFADALKVADKVYVMPIFAAREQNDGSVSSAMLVEEINKSGGQAELMESPLALPITIQSLNRQGIVAVNIGAGDAYAELAKVSYV